MKSQSAKLFVAVLLVLSTTPIFIQGVSSTLKVGKRDDITVTSITKVGGVTLQPGHYILQHRASGGTHAMYFISFIPYGGEPGRTHTYYPYNPLADARAIHQECKMETLQSPVRHTRVYVTDDNGVKRITRLEIKGETVAHTF